MFEFTRNFYTTVESGGGSESSFTPGRTIVSKGRTIISELSRLNKAFGTISKKKTIIGQLSDIADAAEAGKIGGGAFMVRVNNVNGVKVLDKTWQEIYDALKTTSVYIIDESDEELEMIVSTECRIYEAMYNGDDYWVYSDIDNYITASPDGYPERADS